MSTIKTAVYLDSSHAQYIEQKGISLTKYVRAKLKEDMQNQSPKTQVPVGTEHKLKERGHDAKNME